MELHQVNQITKKSLQKGYLRSLIENGDQIQDDNRTVTLTFSTGSKGLRSGWEGSYYEELSMDPQHVDMSRLTSGAPLLAAHDSSSLGAVIGVVERAWLEGNEGKAEVRFAKDVESDKIYQKVKDKILRNVSIGYQVRKYTDVTEKGDKVPTLRATNWQPHEISIVPIGFDPNAQVRSNENLTEVEIESENKTEAPTSTTIEPQADLTNKETRTMSKKDNEVPETSQADIESAKKQAAQEYNQRVLEITDAVKKAGLDNSLALELIVQDITADKARQVVLDKLVEKQAKPVDSTIKTVEMGNENAEMRRRGFEEAILHRTDSANFKVTEGARPFIGKSLLRQMELFVPRYNMESDVVYSQRAMSSSDLPLALANIAEKGLQKQYELQPRTFEQWSRKDTLRNYKQFSQVKSGDYASLIERPEGEEYQMGSFGEKNEIVQIKDYGIIHAFTSQMLVNDDLSVLSRIAQSGGIAASRKENQLAYAALTTNKTMQDSVALYHATHGNLGTAGAISATTVAEAYKLMRKQTSTDGLDALNLAPKFFVCGPDQEATARQFFASINATQTSNVNIYSGAMSVVVDAQLTGNQYYFMADPNVVDTIVCYRLEGQEQPKISSRQKFETDSLELKLAHAFVAAPMDWRGIVKNAGQ
jgi:hypothetical protein